MKMILFEAVDDVFAADSSTIILLILLLASAGAIAWEKSRTTSYSGEKFLVGHAYVDDVESIYYSERGAAPNTIISANVKIPKQRTTDPMKMDKFEENLSSPSVTVLTRIPTPNGTEVNKIYTCEQNFNILFTKSDLNDLHVWDLSSPDSFVPVAILTGHSEGSCDSNFALDSSFTEPRILSGDRDGIILMWSLDASPKNTPGRDANGKIPPLVKFEGHQATVEDVCFNPSSSSEFCSVGDDQKLLFWDERASKSKISEALQGENVDLHCVDWNPSDLNLLVVGTASGATFVIDRRKIGSGEGTAPLHKLHQHQEPVFRVGWRPDSTVHFASGGDDSFVCIWDISQVGTHSESMGETQEAKEVIFKHCGHRGSVQDLHWNPVIPWTLASVSEDATWAMGGGTLQVWRPIDFLYRPEDECLRELEKMQNDLKGSGE